MCVCACVWYVFLEGGVCRFCEKTCSVGRVCDVVVFLAKYNDGVSGRVIMVGGQAWQVWAPLVTQYTHNRGSDSHQHH